jgi:hypothetical protein
MKCNNYTYLYTFSSRLILLHKKLSHENTIGKRQKRNELKKMEKINPAF